MFNVRRRQNRFNPPYLYAPLSQVGRSHVIDMSLCSYTFSLMNDILTLCFTSRWHLFFFSRTYSELLVWCWLLNIEKLYWWPLSDSFVFVANVIEFDCFYDSSFSAFHINHQWKHHCAWKAVKVILITSETNRQEKNPHWFTPKTLNNTSYDIQQITTIKNEKSWLETGT